MAETEDITVKNTNNKYELEPESTSTVEIKDIFPESGRFYGKWHLCARCGEEFPESQLAYIGGKYYCYKYKDAQDEIASRSKK